MRDQPNCAKTVPECNGFRDNWAHILDASQAGALFSFRITLWWFGAVTGSVCKCGYGDLLVPNQAPALVEIYGFLLILSDCC
jgi:hypothetical protein